MAKKKKKNMSLLILIFAMILALIAYVAVLKIKDKKEAKSDTDATTSITLTDFKEDGVTKIEYTNETDELKLTKTDDSWVNEEDSNFPINQSNAQSMVTAIASITSDRLVSENAEDMSEFGLDKPLIKITVTTEDGKTTTINVGSKLVTGSAYYLSLNDEKKVYTVDTTLYDAFKYTNNQMIAMESPPTITADYITELSVDNKDSEDFEAVYDENSENNTSDYSLWAIKKPYSVNVAGDSDKLSDLFANYTTLTFEECADYNAKDLSKYGLDDPSSVVDIKYYEKTTSDTSSTDSSSSSDSSTADSSTSDDSSSEEVRTNHEYKLLIGKKNDNGDYYVKSSDSKAVYVMDTTTVENMIKLNAFDYVSSSVNLTAIDKVEKMEVTSGDETYTLSIKRKTTTDNNGSEQVESTYYCNGNEVKEDDFKTVYEKFLSLTNEAEISKEVTDNTPQVSIKIEKNTDTNKNLSINFLPYDSNYYRVDNNGTQFFVTTKRAVDDYVKAVKELAGEK